MRTLQIGDMFCGAGGSTTGIRQALDAMGYRAKIWAFNHWNIAIDTHSTNYADVEHICASVEQRKWFIRQGPPRFVRGG